MNEIKFRDAPPVPTYEEAIELWEHYWPSSTSRMCRNPVCTKGNPLVAAVDGSQSSGTPSKTEDVPEIVETEM